MKREIRRFDRSNRNSRTVHMCYVHVRCACARVSRSRLATADIENHNHWILGSAICSPQRAVVGQLVLPEWLVNAAAAQQVTRDKINIKHVDRHQLRRASH